MKLLLISCYFPPHNAMGALRVGKFAKYLVENGHDVRVVYCRDQPLAKTLSLEIPFHLVHGTSWIDVNALPRTVQKFRRRLGLAGAVSARPEGAQPVGVRAPEPGPGRQRTSILRKIRKIYSAAFSYPDPQIGWLPFALRAGRRFLRDWKPDVVFSSAPPFTGLIAGHRLARSRRIPWVVEYRDRWTEDPYGAEGRWRKRLDRWIENRLTPHAKGVVTVSEPWAEDYRNRWSLPVEVVYNGFDPDDFPLDADRGSSDPGMLHILYTGVLYPERRDPAPLFAAMATLGADAENVKVDFYGADPDLLLPAISRYGLEGRVEIHDRVSYRESVALQMKADVLLLLQWDDPKEAGNVPGKLFEYLAARRPVLGIGYKGGVPARVLKERDAGVVLTDPDAIAERLRGWIGEKKANGTIPLLPPEVRNGLSRPEQYAKLVRFLENITPE